MKKPAIALTLLIIVSTIVFAGWKINKNSKFKSQNTKINTILKKPKPLEKYAINNLAKTKVLSGKITFADNLFFFEFEPDLKNKKITSGQINIPEGDGVFPVVIMIRGYVDKEIYKTGVGTGKAAVVFAKNGYITMAPDFLGYGDSDKEAENIFEARFQTYTLVLQLIKSLDQILNWDGENIFIWGHSNGGQIALTVLEIVGKNYPTTLWAPVSKPFPYSVLYYTDEAEDKGKFIRSELSKFEDDYDADLYSIHKYFGNIKAPLQIHQGNADDAVPISWSNDLVDTLGDLDVDVSYFKYSGADHNMVPYWDTAVERDLQFFGKNIVK